MLERGYCYAAMTSSPFKSSFSCFHPTARRPLLCLGLLSPLSKVRGNEGRSCCAPYFNFEGGSLYSYACNVGLLTKIGKPGASFEVTLYSLEKRMKRNKKVMWPLLYQAMERFYLPPDNPCCSQCQKALSYTKYGRAFRKKEPQNSAWRASSREMTSIGLSFFSYSLRILGSLLCRYHFFHKLFSVLHNCFIILISRSRTFLQYIKIRHPFKV